MGNYYRLTRKRSCLKGIQAQIWRTKYPYGEDLGGLITRYARRTLSVTELLQEPDRIGYKTLWQINNMVSGAARKIERSHLDLVLRIVYEAGRQDLTSEDVMILAGQQFPTEDLFGSGINLELEMRFLKETGGKRADSMAFPRPSESQSISGAV